MKVFLIFALLLSCYPLHQKKGSPRNPPSGQNILPSRQEQNSNTDTQTTVTTDLDKDVLKFRAMLTAEQIKKISQHLNEQPIKQAFESLRQSADAKLNLTPLPQENLNIPAYYKDKEGNAKAKKPLEDDAQAAYELALAYRLDSSVNRIKYAKKAIEILNAWARVNKRVAGDDGPLTFTFKGIRFIFAAGLLMSYQDWAATDREAFKNWIRTMYLPEAMIIRFPERTNNWGVWGIFGSIAAAQLLEDSASINQNIDLIKEYLDYAIDEKGELPEENLRNNSGMWYTYFALSPLTNAMFVAYNATGQNLFNYTSPKGRNVRQALDRFFKYCLDPNSWPYKKAGGIIGGIQGILGPSEDTLQIPQKNNWGGNLFEAMSVIYKEPSWSDWVKNRRPIRCCNEWSDSTLFRPALIF